MERLSRELIEFEGINKCPITNKTNFNQVNLEQVVCIPGQKPDIESISKIGVKAIIKGYDIVKTPIGKSLEGQIMTGYKLLVCGDIKYKVQYVACEPTQSVHTAHSTFPFCAYAVLPENVNPNVPINPSIAIEDIFAEQMDERCIYNNITMMLLVDIC